MNIKALRKKIGKTQEEMANDLDIKTQTLRNYEMGTREPNIKTIIKLATYFNCSIDELIGYEISCTVEKCTHERIAWNVCLRTKIENQKISQKEFAEMVGITPAALNNYVQGKTEPNIETLINMANNLSCTLDELVGNKKGANIEISPERKELLQMIDTLTDVECHKLKIFALGMVMNRPEKGE